MSGGSGAADVRGTLLSRPRCRASCGCVGHTFDRTARDSPSLCVRERPPCRSWAWPYLAASPRGKHGCHEIPGGSRETIAATAIDSIDWRGRDEIDDDENLAWTNYLGGEFTGYWS